MTYAKGTTVSIPKSKMEIEKLVKRRGADAFGIMEEGRSVKVAFRIEGRHILFRVEMPEKEQQQKERWRALLLVIKGKLESASVGIETIEEAFLNNIVMPSGETVGETVIPAIADHYSGETHVPLLPRS